MAIFISYSSNDKEFVTNLAKNLVFARHNVWIDQWELNAGDSLVDKIQDAIGEADALLVILSHSSIASQWCKKELNAGLMRELEEKQVLVIPCVIDDCSVPIFLKEKLYVDFRNEKDKAYQLLHRSLLRISNTTQSRLERKDFHTDWSVDWGLVDETPVFEWLFVDHGEKSPYCIVTRVRLILDCITKNEFLDQQKSNEHISYACEFLKYFLETIKEGTFRVQISDNREITETVQTEGPDGELAILHCGIRRLGADNGMDTLFTVDEPIRMALNHHSKLLPQQV